MGAADIVVKESLVALLHFITGIYEEFIDSLKSFSTVLPTLKRRFKRSLETCLSCKLSCCAIYRNSNCLL